MYKKGETQTEEETTEEVEEAETEGAETEEVETEIGEVATEEMTEVGQKEEDPLLVTTVAKKDTLQETAPSPTGGETKGNFLEP